ncbi:sodium/glucose cotransporter 4-like isoform X1 [Anneissia japonica]|uniref:sodium/glucose cotransporter 4-like isoform X1 n=1 Tax=Anneissia japonica TaxID=1529436 RepID=UPI001425B13F|nr:sodium/glucose cotransporter 4-like isoform X1 [Anneissia japonica]
MYAGAIIIQQVLGWPLYLSVCLLLFLTAIYTVVGGLRAVIYTDALQTVVMLFGAIVLTIIAFIEIGGMENLHLRYMTAIPNTTQIWGNTTCGVPGEESFHIFRSAQDPSLPWPGVIFGIHILSGWFFCTNQVIVQRTLSAKNVTHAKAGSIMAAYFKILPMYLMIFPGMISRALYTDEVACADPSTCEAICGVPAGCSNIAYPKLVLELMPTGLKGLMMAAMLAALMSSLTSIFNSASTVFTIDIWLMIRKKASEAELMIVGRVCTVGLVFVSVLWLPLIEAYGSGELFVYIQSIASFFAPPFFAAFLLAVFWTRANEKGAFWGLMSGLFIGFTRLILDFIFSPPACAELDERPNIIKNFHYLHFACFLFGTTLFFTIVVSLLTEPIPLQKLNGMTWWTKHLRYSITDDSKEEKLHEDVKCSPAVPNNCGEKENSEMVESKSENREDTSSTEKESILSLLFLFVCGVSSKRLNSDEPEVSYEDLQKEDTDGVSLYEDPKWVRVMNINVVILIGVGVFFYGFYG